MENYLAGRKFVQALTGYKHDLKQYNANFGKKNSFKKSQMWTLLLYVILPLILLGTTLVFIMLYCLVSFLIRCLCGEAKVEVPDKKKQ